MKILGYAICAAAGFAASYYGLPFYSLGYWLVVVPAVAGGVMVGKG